MNYRPKQLQNTRNHEKICDRGKGLHEKKILSAPFKVYRSEIENYNRSEHRKEHIPDMQKRGKYVIRGKESD